MHELVVMGFQERYKADALLTAMDDLEKKCVIELEDAVLVVRDADGTVTVQQAMDTFSQIPTSSAVYFGFLGALTGWILSSGGLAGIAVGLQVGLVMGWILGTAAARYSDVGVPADLVRELSETVVPGSAALALAVRGEVCSEKVLEKLKEYDGKLIRTSLASQEEALIKKALAEAV
ncbi:MAG: DUF1269 domain-containing protein [Desulfomonile tiedjei]|uniref:DUF1269 domain-containing protein n=1 Tax=Desulfomonile tiedjei TaxID=2358 RepID=A0A9D6V3K9_9BACT|nr:DUF1269 domain-containing protein [Desulfomonile tiedjei]